MSQSILRTAIRSMAIAVTLVVAATDVGAQVTVLEHATLIDGTGAQPRQDMTLILENGRIRDLGPSASLRPAAGAQVIDARGKFLVPGIINAHGHVAENRDTH